MSENDKTAALKELEKDDIHEAKRYMVMRFVKDQESLQTSQVDLKLVGDETIDLIDSALVVKEEDNDAHGRINETQNEQLARDISSIKLGKQDSVNTTLHEHESLIVPRPPSRSARPKSQSRKQSGSEGRKRKPSQSSPTNFHQLNPHDKPPFEPVPNSPTQRHNQKTSFNKYAIYSTPDQLSGYNTVDNYADTRDSIFEHPRPKSTRTLRRIRSGELFTARISSANAPERLACDISKLIGTSSRPKSNSYSEGRSLQNNRRTFVNLGAIERQVAFEGPLELEPVHPSEIPIFRSSSAASSAAPYAFVQLPPISTEAHPTSTYPPS